MVSFKRSRKTLWLQFYQSIAGGEAGEKPTAYDVLATITKYDPGTFEDFISNFGYEQYDENTGGINKRSMKIYRAVVKEYNKVYNFFTQDEIDELNEIAV